MTQPVSDLSSNAEENIVHAAQVIGRSSHRRQVFEAIYTGQKKAKSVTDLMDVTGLPRTRVLDSAKRLFDNHIVNRVKGKRELSYQKIGFFQANKGKILRLAGDPAKIAQIPTKRNPGGASSGRPVQIKLSSRRARQEQITVDDLSSFARVQEVPTTQELGNQLSEEEIKVGIQKCLGEGGEFKDWGGEVADVFTTRLGLQGRRRPAAFALKGPGERGKLRPGKMGKNGDQLQRLFEAPADVFVVQYVRQVDLSVHKQMELLAIAKSLMTGNIAYWGVIDGFDSYRLAVAYPRAFPKLKKG